MKRLILLLLMVCMISPLAFSQKIQIDSILTVVKNDKEDTNKVAHLNYLASLYSKQKKYKNAEKQLLYSLAIAEKIGALNTIKSVHFNLTELYKETKKPTKELEHYKKYISLRDSMANIEKKPVPEETKNDQTIIIGSIAGGALFLVLTILLLFRLLQANKQNRQTTAEQKHQRNSNEEYTKRKTELEEFIAQQEQIIEQQKLMLEKYSPIINVDGELGKKKNELTNVLSEYEKNLTKRQELQKELNLLEESLENIDYGFYKPHFAFKTCSEFKVELEKITDEQKEMIKNDDAAICKVEWAVGDSKTEGKKMMKQISKLILRAFNGEADSAIAKVSWSNIVTMEARINKAHETINKFRNTMQISISDWYKELKLKELYLNFELEEKLYKEKEE